MEWQPQRDAFCSSYDVARPQLALRDITHWNAVLAHAAVKDDALHREQAYVAPGYFYMPVADEPDEQRLAELVDLACGADWLLVPSLRATRDPGAAVIAVPFMQAAYFRSSGDVDSTLRAAVGDRQYKAIVRYMTKADAACNTEIHRLADLEDDHRALRDFAVLQALNGAKYGHSRNLYTLDILQLLARSVEGAKYYLKLDYEKVSHTPLCGSLSYADDERGVFTKLVVGLDRDRVPPGLNLLITDKYRMYRYAGELGFDNICLGRGAIDSKLRVGANHVIELVNWLIPINTSRTQAMRDYAMAEFGGRP